MSEELRLLVSVVALLLLGEGREGADAIDVVRLVIGASLWTWEFPCYAVLGTPY